MSISIDKIYNHSQNKIVSNMKNQAAPVKKNQGRQFDEIVISSQSKIEDEKIVSDELATKVIASLSNTTSEEKLTELKNAVHSNSYVIDAQEIAKKILGL